MTRETSTNLSDILFAFRDRLIANIEQATQDNTYISTIPEALPPGPDELMFEVALGQNISFDGPIIVGAGQNSLNTKMQVLVTVHITQSKDEVGRDLYYLTHETLGVSPLMKSVLKALAATDPTDIEDANEFLLSQYVQPLSAIIPPKDKREKGYITVVFDVVFDWDMS